MRVNLMERSSAAVAAPGSMTGEAFMRRLWIAAIVSFLLGIAPGAAEALAQSGPTTAQKAAVRDGQHDFDFEAGSWNIHLRKLLHPLSGSTAWVDFDGTSATRSIWGGRGFLEQFETDGAAGHIEGLTLRLYDPQSQQWRLYWANSKDGVMETPMIGAFRNGRGEFFDQELLNGRAIYVRFIWSKITANSAHFEQSFSDDGGKTWEVNWITDQTRTGPEPSWSQAQDNRPSTPDSGDGAAPDAAQQAFAFDAGRWTMQMKRLADPLSGSQSWYEMSGRSVVEQVWGGRANLALVEADGPKGHLELLALRLYQPQARQWSIFFATSDGGILSVPCVGRFSGGRGEFYDQEAFHGRSILVRFRIWPVSPDSFTSDQAFSDDGGKTWETNWVNTGTREGKGEAQ